MGAHFIHCSDGVDLVIDRVPHRFRRIGEAVEAARRRARELIAAIPGHRDWDDWSAYVYDDAGEVARVSFSAILAEDALRRRIPKRPARPSLSIVRDTGPAAPERASCRAPRSLPEDRDNAFHLVLEHP